MMLKNYKICPKLNYATESIEKQANVDMLTKLINQKMQDAGYRPALKKDKTIDYVFSIGGDGTMLYSMHYHLNKNATIIGINAGNVGFLTPYNIADVVSEEVFRFLESEVEPRVEKRSVLSHILGKKKGIAVNEYAITAEGPNDMLDYSIEIEYKGHVSRAGHYKSNALLISGPCGSTAYNMNAGGAIVDPTVRCMQMVMIAPTTLGARPIIIGKNAIIHVKMENHAKIYSDGILYHEVNSDETMSISLMAKESNVLLPDAWNFYSVLSKKLHWNNGQDV